MTQPAIRLPIGISDFSELITTGKNLTPYTFIDKTLLIRDFLYDGAKVILWTRPRRFGKTLNLSMLYHFLSCTEQHEQDLFEGLKIKEAGEAYLSYQGQYPVIFISFKDIKKDTFKAAYQSIENLLRRLFEQYAFLLDKGHLSKKEADIFTSLLNRSATTIDIELSLQFLSKCLYDYYQKKVMMFIDEYDAPIYAADAHHYYPEMIDLIRGLFSAGLKDNSYLEKAGITGILRVAKEDIFSGVNHLVVDSFLDWKYAPYFGFTEADVAQLFALAAVPTDLAKVQSWYNGYRVKDITLYNPWSIINCLAQNGEFAPYWSNTSDNHLIKKLLLESDVQIKEDFERLMQGKSIEGMLDPFLNLKDLEHNHMSIFTLLCMSGYLNAVVAHRVDGDVVYHFRIPNQEIKIIYRRMIEKWLSAKQGGYWLKHCMNDLKAMRMNDFTAKLQQIALNIFSYHDVKGRLPESFFHGFLLGLIVCCQAEYTITSNREAGKGRFDIAMIPKDANGQLPGIVFEIKSLANADMAALEASAAGALAQIDEKQYAAVFSGHPQMTQLHIGVAFSGKLLAVRHHQP